MRSSTLLFYINAWIGIAGFFAHLSVRVLNPIGVVTLGGCDQLVAGFLTILGNVEFSISSPAERIASALALGRRGVGAWVGVEIDRIRGFVVRDPRDTVVVTFPECCLRRVNQTLTRLRRIGVDVDPELS